MHKKFRSIVITQCIRMILNRILMLLRRRFDLAMHSNMLLNRRFHLAIYSNHLEKEIVLSTPSSELCDVNLPIMIGVHLDEQCFDFRRFNLFRAPFQNVFDFFDFDRSIVVLVEQIIFCTSVPRRITEIVVKNSGKSEMEIRIIYT